VAYRRAIERLKEGEVKRKIQAVQVEAERKQAEARLKYLLNKGKSDAESLI